MNYGSTTIAFPPLTPGIKLLMLINGAAFVLNMLFTPVVGADLGKYLGVWWGGLFEWFGLGVLRLFTYQFLHSFIDPLHILVNMLTLWMFGGMVEQTMGKRRLITFYLTAGVLGALLEMGLHPNTPIIGASGACYAILVYAACLYPRAQVILIVFPLQLRVLAILLVALAAYHLYTMLAVGGRDGVAHGAHLGGALYGFLAYKGGLRLERYLERIGLPWQRWRAARSARRSAADQETMDRLLDKVRTQGLTSLTPAERRYLDRRSRALRER
jgi:membrane associated rhomboid family serine protease